MLECYEYWAQSVMQLPIYIRETLELPQAQVDLKGGASIEFVRQIFVTFRDLILAGIRTESNCPGLKPTNLRSYRWTTFSAFLGFSQ
jgi:hypothetical protein